MSRAAALSPELRRESLIAATLPLLSEHGRAVTTRQIAEAAAVAEGTIFRVFDSKDDLIDAAMREAFNTDGLLQALGAIDPGLPLRERMLAVVSLLQTRLAGLFSLMDAVGVVRPPDHDNPDADRSRREIDAALLRLVVPDAAHLRVEPARLIILLRLLTFSGTHRHISDGAVLSPEEIVDTVLFGVSRPEGHH